MTKQATITEEKQKSSLSKQGLNFKLLNNIGGWAVFAISLIVYLMTVERTASFWDCGEFIACSYKLQVPHPPGAPFFLLVGRMFSFLAAGDVTLVAYWINVSSALCSAFTILFLFWTITLFGAKLFPERSIKNLSDSQIITLLGAGLVGSLAYTFSDSFWFSAVEAEVYAMSSFFTAFVVWAMLKWELIEDESQANKWLILIAYMMGLSIGVHLLNLVTIPALALIFYYKKFPPQSQQSITQSTSKTAAKKNTSQGVDGEEEPFIPWTLPAIGIGLIAFRAILPENNEALGMVTFLVVIAILGIIGYIFYQALQRDQKFTLRLLATLAISGAIIIVILEGIIPGLPTLAGNIEVLFVNSFGLPFGAGIIFITVLVIGAVVYGIYYSVKNEKVILNTALLSLAFILVGYSAYVLILIRSNYNPPINENDPSNIIRFVSYLKREQYGDRPLVYGPTFNSDVKRNSDGSAVRISKGKLYRINYEKGIYEPYNERFAYDYEDKMLLPRIYSRQDNHRQLYIQKIYGGRDIPPDYKPTMADNLKFLFSYQFGHMYWRYFLWNFAGRAGDAEGSAYLTPVQSKNKLPNQLAENKAYNQFYMLPLLLGILGVIFLFQKSQQTFFITAMLFFLTGLALVLYLNSPPVEPRERDYIYVGSYYAFAIWIGFGVMFIAELLKNFIKNPRISPIIATAVCLVVPGIMAAAGWDDHDRSNRYHSIDSAKNLLNSCAPNAVLFTGGDNDTFPLWYVQEVEGFRTDVRVCNLSLLGTDWYIDQMKRPAYESDALPISLEHDEYIQGTNDQILYPPAWKINTNLSPKMMDDLSKKGMDLKGYINLVKKGDKMVKAFTPGSEDEDLTIIPSRKLVLKTDKAEILKLGFVPKDKENLIGERIAWDLQTNELYKNDLIILDMIATNDWKRPIYFSTTLANSSYLNLKEFMQREGLAFRLMPFKVEGAREGFVNSDIMYKNMMENFYWRELDNPNTYYDENYERFVLNLRDSFYRLADQLIKEGKKEEAKKALNFILDQAPDEVIPFDAYSYQLIDGLFRVDEKERALNIADKMANRADEMLAYLIDDRKVSAQDSRIRINMAILGEITQILKKEGQTEKAKDYEARLENHYAKIAGS